MTAMTYQHEMVQVFDLSRTSMAKYVHCVHAFGSPWRHEHDLRKRAS
jgi:hypothetical protein